MSNSSSAIAHVVATLKTVATLALVEQSPVTLEAWKKAYFDAGRARMPAMHVGLRESTESSQDTDAGELEVLPLRLTVLQRHTETTLADVYTLRDAILDVVYAGTNLSQGGYADTTDFRGFSIVADNGDHTEWNLDFDVSVSWDRHA